VSLLDPPEEQREAAAALSQRRAVAGPGRRGGGTPNAVLALADHPLRPPAKSPRKSPGDLFDGTEIDEILDVAYSHPSPKRKRRR